MKYKCHSFCSTKSFGFQLLRTLLLL